MSTSNHLPPQLGQILRDFDPAPEIIRVLCVECRKTFDFKWPHSTTNEEISHRLKDRKWEVTDPDGKDARCPSCAKTDPCPRCGEQLECQPGGGVACSSPNCTYWFCY